MRTIARIVTAAGLLFASLASAASLRIVVRVPADTPAGDDVYVAGSLPAVGAWKADGLKLARQADGTHAADISVDAGQTLAFKITRGTWATVEKAADGQDRPDRTLTADAAVKAVDVTVARWAGPAEAVPHTVVGNMKVRTIDSVNLKRPVTLRVWLPPGYDADGVARYDVIYFHDGQNCFDRATSAFGQEWQVDETLTRLIDAKSIRPLIAVGIDNGGASRIADYTFTHHAKYGGGQAEAYARFLLEEAKPLIEKSYRVEAGPEHTFLAGSSLGGLVTLEIARRHPGVFGGIVVMSPSLWWGQETLTADLENDASGFGATRIWLDMGTAEESGVAGETNVTQARKLATALARHKIEHRLTIDDGAKHNEPAWAKRLPMAVEYLTATKGR